MTGSSAAVDPRIERSRRVIQEAVIAEMGEVGYGAMTIEAVAKRAGVSKATIYRQWSNKLEVVAAALQMFKDDIPLADTDSAVDRLTALLTWLATYLADANDPASACVPAMVSAAQYDPAVRTILHEFSGGRRQLLLDTVIDGQRRGEIDGRLDADLTVDLLVGPLFYRRLMTDDPFPVSAVTQLVETVLGEHRGRFDQDSIQSVVTSPTA